jgi:hypothetical protein
VAYILGEPQEAILLGYGSIPLYLNRKLQRLGIKLMNEI